MESVRYLLGRTFSKCQESIDSEWALHSLDSGETQPWASYIPWRVGDERLSPKDLLDQLSRAFRSPSFECCFLHHGDVLRNCGDYAMCIHSLVHHNTRSLDQAFFSMCIDKRF